MGSEPKTNPNGPVNAGRAERHTVPSFDGSYDERRHRRRLPGHRALAEGPHAERTARVGAVDR
jgi:hypothetical protein